MLSGTWDGYTGLGDGNPELQMTEMNIILLLVRWGASRDLEIGIRHFG